MVHLSPRTSLPFICSAALLLLLPALSFASINRTIDDSFGDSLTGKHVIYTPTTNIWKEQPCNGCAIVPDSSRAFKGTYTSATSSASTGPIGISMQFTGTAIYVFFTLANNQGAGTTAATVANFVLDGSSPVLFQHQPDISTTDILYQMLVFTSTNLADAEHTLVISTSGISSPSYLNFDYAIYTQEDVQPQPQPTSAVASETVVTVTNSLNEPTISTKTSPISASGSTTANSQNQQTFTTGQAAITLTTTSTASGLSGTATVAADGTPLPTPTGSDSGTKANTRSPTALISGAVVGGIVLILLAILVLLYSRRRRRKVAEMIQTTPTAAPGQSRGAPYIQPFTDPPSGKFPPSSKVEDDRRVLTAYDSQPPVSGYSDSGPHIFSPGHASLESKSATGEYSTETSRTARKNEIGRRLHGPQGEMSYLVSDVGNAAAVPTESRPLDHTPTMQDGAAVLGLQEQLRNMREQIIHLQEQQRLASAQELSDDLPPPGYHI